MTQTRFAPSPTGFLHLGHVASAAVVYGLGRALGARIILRIEDHDRSRSRAEFESAIHTDLEWLGFEFDDGELSRRSPSPFRQSDARAVYDQTLACLDRKGLLYGCDCTRSRLRNLQGDAAAADELAYDGHCRERGLDWRNPGIGVRLVLPDDTVYFKDAWLGPSIQTPSTQCGDLLVRDRHGHDTYQFAVVVDDIRHGIDLVIRGQDLLASTGRQILLAQALGRRDQSTFAHHPLLVDDQGQKLGKRFFSEAIAKRRAEGELPENLLGLAIQSLGLKERNEPIAAAELPAFFRERMAP